jgi:hypothetical protein
MRFQGSKIGESEFLLYALPLKVDIDTAPLQSENWII